MCNNNVAHVSFLHVLYTTTGIGLKTLQITMHVAKWQRPSLPTQKKSGLTGPEIIRDNLYVNIL